MKLFSLTIENFRCYKEPFKIHFDDFTALIAKNDSGKSTILEALDVFFNDTALDSGDISVGSTSSEIKITGEFTDLPLKLVIDSTNEISLSDEYLLNSSCNLEIIKTYAGAKPKVKEIHIRAVHPSVEHADDLLQLNITELKARAKELKVGTASIKTTIKAQLRKAIRESFTDLGLKEQLILILGKEDNSKDDRKKIWDRLKIEMPLFALFKSDRPSTDQDDEAQDPMKQAIKEALAEKQDELNHLTEYVKKKVTKIANATVNKLKEMDSSLANELAPKISDPKYDSIFKVSLTDDSQIPVNKRGSGVRRLILINFFRAKAENLALTAGAPGIIYAIEEPETSQHPNNQILIMNAFNDLVSNGNCQVIISTHTPTLVRLLPSTSIRYIEKKVDNTRVLCPNNDDTFRKITKDLGILADHDIKLFIGVEGANDINFFKIISKILSQYESDIPDLEQMEKDGKVLFIPLGGSNLALWTDRLSGLGRPELHIYDRDTTPPERPKYQDSADRLNSRPNCHAHITEKREIENYLHPTAISNANSKVKISFSDYDDVPLLAAKQVHIKSESERDWITLNKEEIKEKTSKCKKWLNRDAVAKMTPELLSQQDSNDEIRKLLRLIAEYLSPSSFIDSKSVEIVTN